MKLLSILTIITTGAAYFMFGTNFLDGSFAASLQHFKAPKTVQAKIARVIDGDTVDIISKTWPSLVVRIRIRDIDTPEITNKAKCIDERLKGKAAKEFAAALLSAGDPVTLSSIKPDKYPNRLDAHIQLKDGRYFSNILIEKGHAKRWFARSPKPVWCS